LFLNVETGFKGGSLDGVFPGVTLYFAGGAMELSPDQYMIQQEVGVCLFSTISPSQTLLSLFSSNQTLQILRIEVLGLNLLHQNEEVFSANEFA
jgi:hypothetical protein